MAEQPPKLTSEQKLIEAIKSWVGESFIGDDCAVLPGRALVTSDSLVEGTHFSLSWTSLADLGWKAVAVNLSDIAAMAGRPRHLVVNLTMPPGFALRQCRELFLSMAGCARAYRSDIVGGDLTCGPLLVLSVTVLGEAHERGCLPLWRAAGRCGHRLGGLRRRSGRVVGSDAGDPGLRAGGSQAPAAAAAPVRVLGPGHAERGPGRPHGRQRRSCRRARSTVAGKRRGHEGRSLPGAHSRANQAGRRARRCRSPRLGALRRRGL